MVRGSMAPVLPRVSWWGETGDAAMEPARPGMTGARAPWGPGTTGGSGTGDDGVLAPANRRPIPVPTGACPPEPAVGTSGPWIPGTRAEAAAPGTRERLGGPTIG